MCTITLDRRSVPIRTLVASIALTACCAVLCANAGATVIVTAATTNIVDAPTPFVLDDRIDAVQLADGRRIEIDSLLDWKHVEALELPLRAARIFGHCEQRDCVRDVYEGAADIAVSAPPDMPTADAPTAMRIAERIEQATRAGDRLDAEVAYVRFASEATRSSAENTAWVHWYAARAASAAGNSDLALQRLDAAIALADPASLQTALIREERGRLNMLARQFTVAASDLDAAIELRRRVAPAGIALASALTRRAEISSRAAQPQAALKFIEEALALLAPRCRNCRALSVARGIQAVILTRLDRHSDALPAMRECVAILRALDGPTAEVARRLAQVSIGTRSTGDYAAAERAIEESLQIYQTHPGPALDVADAWLERGTIAHVRETPDAERYWRRALETFRTLAPGSDREAGALNNLGFAAADRGDLVEARSDLQAALAIYRAADAHSRETAKALFNLGRVEDRAGNLDAAQDRLIAARDIQRAINPAGRTLGASLVALGAVQTRLGRLDDAATSLADGAAIYEKLPKDCYCLAPALLDIGRFELARGSPAAALSQFERARELFASQQPDGLDESEAWQGVGETQLELGHLAQADAALARARAVRARDAPDDADYAQTLYALGRLSIARRQPARAGEYFCAASRVLDRAGQRAGGDSFAQTLFRSQHAQIYQACFDAQIDAGRDAAAFDTLERQRARSFLDALQQREPDWSRHAPNGWLNARNANQSAQQHATEQLTRATATPQERNTARLELTRLRKAGVRLQQQLDDDAPLLSTLLSPARQSGADLARRRLPENTVLLSYSVRERDSVLLIVDRSRIKAHILPIGRGALSERIANLRAAIARHDAAELSVLQEHAAALYDLLIAPAQREIAAADHLLLSPDGPLHNLPFAALWQREHAAYFGAAHAFSLIDTLATWGELQGAPGAGPRHLLAVADPTPQAPSTAGQSSERAAFAQAEPLPALPAARIEVAALAKLRGAASEVLLGTDATETRVSAAAGRADILHFAVHALLSAASPLDSALLLRADADSHDHRGDGLLQVWEIFQDLQLDADLVVLSSCETAQGKEFHGEGLLGFTRAFELAGAHAVLASLWKVQDAPTAALMQRFYMARAERAGDARALQTAIRGMLQETSNAAPSPTRGIGRLSRHEDASDVDLSHPYFWSAFQLYGAAR